MSNSASTIKPAVSPGFLKRNATQQVIPLSIIVAVTGVMMFFHLAQDKVSALHEWLGLAFVVAMVLHIMKNSKPFINSANTPRTRLFIGLFLIVSASFVFYPKGEEDNPFRKTTTLLMNASIADAAPVFGLSGEEMVNRLAKASQQTVTTTDSIQSISDKTHQNPVVLLRAVASR